jgi:UDP-GlcNAc:undecaprenyl-phosphate/decaprenyl-phosphate GlcNAc-1-phosphate transferase
MNPLLALGCLAALFALEWAYLRVADRLNIIDKPNQRSLHTRPVVRGGGIVFWFGLVIYCLLPGAAPGWRLPLAVSALVVISLLDDMFTLPNRYRLPVHIVAIGLILWQTGLFPVESPVVWGLTLVLCVGILNAYNFMDGINGITAFYSAVTVGSVWVVNQVPTSGGSVVFADERLLIVLLLAVGVFSFFNARRRALCFAGDVGSIGMAGLVIYLLNTLIVGWQNPVFLLFLLVYGIDTVCTIVQRLYRRENIFEAHKLHLFQLLVYRRGWSHLTVAGLYAGIQLVVNLLIISSLSQPSASQSWLMAGLVVGLGAVYVGVKYRLQS